MVNDTAVAAEDIYIGDGGSNSLLVSSVDVKKPDQIVDNTMILSQYVDIYVSESAFYLYQRKGYWDDVVTQIAKFDLSDGKMNAVGAVSANGRVTDTFAVNECEGKLRVLTSGQNAVSGEAENNLYLFDENLNLTGKIEGLAQEKKSMRRVIWGIWLILLLIAIQIRSLQWICRMTKIPRYSVN